MDQQPATQDEAAALPVRDVRMRFVQRTTLLLTAMALVTALIATAVHWQQAHAHTLDRVMPALLSLAYGALLIRQLRHPERLVSTMWIGWGLGLVAIATPAWLFVWLALRDGAVLVETLPPIGALFPPFLVIMAVFARARHAWCATAIAWGLIAAPVLGYLLLHPDELRSPRGLELAIALGPLSLLAPLLIPLMRGVEQRFHAMREEGERLQQLAERDVLIGLYNRRAGERFLATLLAHSRDDAVLILFDIDHFKRINDRFGHPAGDAVLIEVGRRCSAVIGRDDIFARWGGEEFLVVLPNAPRDSGPGVAERLRGAINSGPIAEVGLVSASFGVTAVRPGDTLAEIIQRADEALYRAKTEGRNRVVAN
jgi:diguanylate cyclase (GGDEF)-like protein